MSDSINNYDAHNPQYLVIRETDNYSHLRKYIYLSARVVGANVCVCFFILDCGSSQPVPGARHTDGDVAHVAVVHGRSLHAIL